jgi:hypothetical protein
MFHTASGVLAISGTMEVSGTISSNQFNVLSQSVVTSHFSASGNTKFGDTTDDIHQFTGSVNIGGALSASGDMFAAGVGVGTPDEKAAFRISGDVEITGTIKNTSFVSSSGEVYGVGLRTSDNVAVTGTITNSSFISSSGEIFSAGGFRNSGTGNSDIAFSGTLKNKSFISASGEVFAAGTDVDPGFRTSGQLNVSGSTDFKDIVSITGSDPGAIQITGSGQSLITLNTMPGDALKEIAFKKDGSTQSSVGIDNDSHVFVENESTKDIILRANNQNTVRVFGNQQRVEIAGGGVDANATLDIDGTMITSGSMTISGSVTLGNTLSNDIIFVSGTLTASKGITLQDNALMPTGKKLLLTGSALNASASIQHIGSNGHFQISGSGVNGTTILGSKILLDHTDASIFPPALEKGLVLSGAVAGPGSYLGLSSTGQIILTSAVPQLPGSDTNVFFNNSNVMSASANLAFDYDDAELSQAGTLGS